MDLPAWMTFLMDFVSEFEGLIGAVLGALFGLLASYGSTSRAHRFETERASREQTLDGVASVIQRCLSLVRKQSYETPKEEFSALQAELLIFHVHQLEKRPKTAEWAKSQSDMIRLRHWYEMGDAIAWSNSKTIVSDLSDWVRDGCPEGGLQSVKAIKEWEATSKRFQDALSENVLLRPPEDEAGDRD